MIKSNKNINSANVSINLSKNTNKKSAADGVIIISLSPKDFLNDFTNKYSKFSTIS